MLDIEGIAHVKHYRYSHAQGSYIIEKTSITTDEKISEQLDQYLKDGDTFYFSKFECFNSEGILQGIIYTSHVYLFD